MWLIVKLHLGFRGRRNVKLGHFGIRHDLAASHFTLARWLFQCPSVRAIRLLGTYMTVMIDISTTTSDRDDWSISQGNVCCATRMFARRFKHRRVVIKFMSHGFLLEPPSDSIRINRVQVRTSSEFTTGAYRCRIVVVLMGMGAVSCGRSASVLCVTRLEP